MPINSIDRFVKYVIPESITTLGNVTGAIDYNFPLDFKAWLTYFKDTSVSLETYKNSFKEYINNWNEVKNTFLINQNNLVKENYITVLKELSLDVFTEQERRFLNAVDFNDPNQLNSVLPLVTRKLKKLTTYYSSFREKIKTQPRRNNTFSSSSGIKSFLTTLFRDLLLYNSKTISIFNENLVDKNFVLDNTNFVIEELYDSYQDYFDLDNEIPSSLYEYGGKVREDQWKSNTNDFDPDLFNNYDRSATKILSSYEYVIEGFISNLSLPVALSANDVQYYKNKDFKNQINTGNLEDLNLDNKKKLFEKFIGSDWYYFNTLLPGLSSKLIEAKNESTNFFNRNNVSTGTNPNVENLLPESLIGGYYTPQYLGSLIYNTFNYQYKIDYSKIVPGTNYYFPDPEKYIHTYGNSKYKRSADIFEVVEDVRVVAYNISNSALFGYINDQGYYLNYHGYENREEKNLLDDSGVSRGYDKVDFFKGKTSSVFSNSDVYSYVNKALYPIDLRQQKLLVSKNDLIFNSSDVYGNSYGLYKQSSFLPFTTERESFNNITINNLFISNGTFFQGNTEFNYVSAANGDYGNSFNDIIPNQSFTFSLSSISQPTFQQNITNAFNFGVFIMPWSFLSGIIYNRGNTFDGVSYTDYYGNILPDNPNSDSPAWDVNSNNYYYNLLLDGGSDINGARPNFRRHATFLHELSASIDGGKFTYQQGNDPFEGTFNIANKYRIPYYDTIIPNLSTSYVDQTQSTKQSIYNKKYSTISDSYFRNNSNIVTALSASLSSIYLKYSGYPEVYNELNDSVIKLDVIYDIAIIETSNYTVIEKINYNYTNDTITVNDSNLRFLSRTTQGNNNLEKFGNFFYHESSNTILFHKTTLHGTLSSTNFKYLYPTFYKMELDNLELKQIYPKKTKNLLDELDRYSLKTQQDPNNPLPSSDVCNYNIVEIDRPVLSYDVNSNIYGYMYKAVDLSDCISFVYLNFKYENGIFVNTVNDLIFQNAKIRDENYSNPVRSSFLSYSSLEGTNNNEWIQKEGVLKLGEQQ